MVNENHVTYTSALNGRVMHGSSNKIQALLKLRPAGRHRSASYGYQFGGDYLVRSTPFSQYCPVHSLFHYSAATTAVQVLTRSLLRFTIFYGVMYGSQVYLGPEGHLLSLLSRLS